MSAQVFKSREGFDSNKHKIINVADGVDSLDAVNVQQMLAQIALLTAGRIVPYSEVAGYAEGSLVIYKNKLYRTDTFIAKPAGAFNPGIWTYIGYDIDDINGGSADTLYSSLRIDQLLAALTASDVAYSNNTNIPNSPTNVQLAIEEIHRNLTAVQSGVRYLGILIISTVPVTPISGDYYFAGYDGTNANINGGVTSFLEGNTIIYNGTDWDIIAANVGVLDIDGDTGSVTGKLVRTDALIDPQTIATTIDMSLQPIKNLADPIDGKDAVNKDTLDAAVSAGGVVTGAVSILEATDTSSGDPLSLTTNVHGEATGINTLNGNITIKVYVERDNTGSYAPANVRWSKNDGTVTNIAANLLIPEVDNPGLTYDLVLPGLVDADTIQLFNGDTKFETTISIVSQIVISTVIFDDNAGPSDIYPTGQTAVKVGDTVNITATSATQFTSMTVTEISGSTNETFSATVTHTMAVIVTAADNAAENASVVIADSNGDSNLVQSSNTIVVSSVVPTVAISVITYPANQNAIKSTEAATLTISHSNADSMAAVSATSELSIPAIPSPTSSLVVTRQSGGYNVSTTNISVTVTATNGNTANDTDVVKIADTAPSLVIDLPSTQKLRSAGDLAEQETIIITSDQELRTALTIDLTRPDAGTSSGLTATGFSLLDTTVDFVITVDEAWGKGSVVGALVTNTAGENLAGVAASIGATNIDFNGFYPKLVVIVGPNNAGDYGPLDLTVKIVDTADLVAQYHRVNAATPGFAPYAFDPSVTSNTDSGADGPIGYGIIANGGLNDDDIVIDFDSVVFFGGDNVEINIEEL